MPPLNDLSGLTFGRLTVLKRASNFGDRVMWECRCSCGTVLAVRAHDLKSGKHRSCGCLHKDVITKHSHYRTPEYTSWQSMKSRCRNPRNPGFSYYGGRGIKVCDRWLTFANFLADMGSRPSLFHSLDRIDPNGNYCPENCRWATKKEQGQHTRRSRFFAYNGEERTLPEWAELFGVDLERLRSRVFKLHWPLEKALTTPLITRRERDEEGRWV